MGDYIIEMEEIQIRLLIKDATLFCGLVQERPYGTLLLPSSSDYITHAFTSYHTSIPSSLCVNTRHLILA